MAQIVPAFLVESKKEFEKNLRLVENDCNLIQVDILDGTLFPNTNWFDAERVGSLKTDVEMELHLMVENPIPIIEQWQTHVPTLKRAIVHAEIHRPLGAVIDHIQHNLKLEAGIAINPETPLSAIESVLHVINQLTIMSVHPGSQGQSFGDMNHTSGPEAIFEKIKQARRHQKNLSIEIDGGITKDLLKPLILAGVNLFGMGSFIFKSKNPTTTLRELNTYINQL
jgi:ribulose-phosphate 3-epimerase